MMIKLNGITNDLLEEIVEKIGSLSIKDVHPYEAGDIILYDVIFNDNIMISTGLHGFNIIRDFEQPVMLFVDQCRFTQLIVG